MKISLFAASAAVLTILACAAPSTAAAPLVLTDIRWIAIPADGDVKTRFRVSDRVASNDMSLDGDRPEIDAARPALERGAGPVAFTIAHAAGSLACSGTLAGPFDGHGTCRFTSNPAFEAALVERGLAPRRRRDLLAMLVVNVTIELADGLVREGVKPKDAEDLIAAAALELTPAYIRDLKSEAMVVTDIDDAIALRAVKVDGAYLRGLAAAGYRDLGVDDVVGMKAVGVSDDYAQAMNRVAQGSGQ